MPERSDPSRPRHDRGLGVAVFAGVAAAVAFASLASCGAEASTAPSCPAADLMLAASDETSSSVLGLLALDGGTHFYAGGTTLGADPVLTSSAGRTFWIDRTNGNILELDPRCGTVLHEWSANDPGVSGTTDPQDVAVAPNGDVWVARLDVSTLLVASSDGSSVLGRIDLSNVTGIRRNPYMSSIHIVDGGGGSGAKAYVTLEMLTVCPTTGLCSIDPSYIVRLDVATALQTGKVEALLQLKARNPFGLIVESGGALYLAEPGNFDLADETSAGIERVDLATFTSELIVRESDIGASVAQVSVQPGCGIAIVAASNSNNNTSVVSFDPSSGVIRTPLSAQFLYTSAGYKLSGTTWLAGGLNAIGDGTASDRGYPVHVLSASSACTFTETSRALFAPEPPIALLPIP